MAMSMYAASVPVFQHMLRNLAHILDRGEASAQARGFDPAALTTYRLAPDMLPFTRQVLIACDAAKLGVARIAGVEAPKFEDTEATFAELKARIQKTLDFLQTVPAGAVDGTEDKGDHLHRGPREDPHDDGAGLSHHLGAAQLLLPRDHGLRHPAAQRGGPGQGRLPGGQRRALTRGAGRGRALNPIGGHPAR